MGDRVKEFNSLTNSGRRFRYLNFEDRVTTVNSVVQVATLRYSKRAEKIADNSTHFLEELKNIRNNFEICDDFVFYFNEVFNKVQSPEMLLHNLSTVVDITVEHLLVPNTQALNSILELIVTLSIDMRGELIKYYDKLLTALLSLLDQKEPERTSNVFQTLVLMFRNLSGNDIRNNISLIRKYYGPLFGNRAPFIRQFACESYCYLLRHMGLRSHQGNGTESSAKRLSKEQLNEQIKELTIILKAVARKPTISDSMILGISSLLFESIRGVSGQARQHGLGIYKSLLDIVIGKKSLEKDGSNMPSTTFISVMLELQYVLAEYILPVHSNGFIMAILESLSHCDPIHAGNLIDILTIWIQFNNGSHCEANPAVFDACLQQVIHFTNPSASDDLRGSLLSLTYALWTYCSHNQSKITVQLKLIQRFVALIGSISTYSETIFLRIHEYSTYLFNALNRNVGGTAMMKSLVDAVFGLCLKMLLCDSVDELDENTKESVKDCENMKRMMDRMNEQLTESLNLRPLSQILHVLNEMNALTTSSRAICKQFIEKRISEYEVSHTHSRLSIKQWSNEEIVCMSECIQGVMSGDVSIDWILTVIHSMSREPVIMKQIAGKVKNYDLCLVNLHRLPSSSLTESLLRSLLSQYHPILSSSSHLLRESWLQFFCEFTQPEVHMFVSLLS
ncbi:hypothetical protein JH06_0312 [Blastocystis sp. subtype 4]|uniref:hypothetical protein n=1 Tax=Blastocystis sp. subtype 4 TaxID=944170 RepID=UPI000711D939|nr:hypothetical protein JH06_0312 [Blastocystis sp. subtype 4]KNB46185.1 hypothetical protein JH06_0312 [Blastocystis sp. subtype 4]|eukprot:XP_014529628.1 hypothetical protein JH06_0312 [Blastocystis sp. subtype 4]